MLVLTHKKNQGANINKTLDIIVREIIPKKGVSLEIVKEGITCY